jgi:hypothetical protein
MEGYELPMFVNPFGSRCDLIGIAPVKGLESKASAELKSSSSK